MEFAAILASLNSVILFVLIYMYGKMAWRTKARFPIGLMIFALLLLSHNLLTVYAYASMAPLFGSEALPFLSAVAALEFCGLIVLFKITL